MTPKVRLGIVVLLTVWVVLVGGLAVGADRGGDQATLDRLEAAVAAAKAEHRLRPGPDTLAGVEAAVSALQGALATRPGSPLAQATEVEPNSTIATATALAAVDYGTGSITPAADIDFWSSAGAATGNLVFAHVDTGESSGGTDSTLNVLANDGTTVIEFDDDDGGPLESVVAGAPVPQTGNVFFEVHEYADNGTITPYHLTVVVVDPATAIAETEPNGTAATANPVGAAMMTAQLSPGLDIDFYAFSAAAGDRLCVIVDNDPDNNAAITPTQIDILGTDGTTVLLVGDNGGGDGNAAGTVVAAASGTYYLRVQKDPLFTGTSYTFAVVVNGRAVPVELQKLTLE